HEAGQEREQGRVGTWGQVHCSWTERQQTSLESTPEASIRALSACAIGRILNVLVPSARLPCRTARHIPRSRLSNATRHSLARGERQMGVAPALRELWESQLALSSAL